MSLLPKFAATAALAGLAAAVPVAAADPPAGRVEVRNEAGIPVGPQLSGPDALQAALSLISAGPFARTDDARPWTIVAGAGAYGDVKIDEPNVAVTPAAGAAVAITGTGGADATGGGCIDIVRGGVTVEGIACHTPAGRGVEVAPPPSEGGIVLRGLGIDQPRSDGIAVLSGAGVLIDGCIVSGAGSDGIRLQALTGPGPYRIQGGAVRQSAASGLDLVNDAQRVQVASVTVEANRGYGIRSTDAGSTDLSVDGSVVSGNGSTGVLFGGGGLRLSLTNSRVSGNGGFGADLAVGTGFVLRGDSFDGTNRLGDVRFTPDTRAGGAYDGLSFLGTPLALPGEPRGVVLSALTTAQRRSLSRLPAGLASLGRFVRVKDSGGTPSSLVTLRFPLAGVSFGGLTTSSTLVYEDDPPGNRRRWQGTGASRFDPAGAAEVTLSDKQIASGSDARFAVYSPLARRNAPPSLQGVYPAEGAVIRGRNLVVAARVGDDNPLGTGSFALVVDGRRIGGVSYQPGTVIFPFVRLGLGLHQASILVADAGGLQAVRAWSFRVVNRRPRIRYRIAHPRRRSFVLSRGLVRFSIPVRDDDPVRARRVRLFVDGRRVPVRVLRGRRVVATRYLGQGLHRLRIVVRDRDGAVAARGWRFRTVRP